MRMFVDACQWRPRPRALLACASLCALLAACQPAPPHPPAQPPARAPLPAPARLPELVDDAAVLVPGVSIGPIRLGMSEPEIVALGVLRPHPKYGKHGATIPYQVRYNVHAEPGEIVEGRVSVAVDLSLTYAPGDVRIGTTTIPRGASFKQVHELLGDCTVPEIGFGGGGYTCRGGLVVVGGGSGSPNEVWIGTTARPPGG
jgi:hypothetical protein